jgi:phosphotransferase system HPr (HPr) family protein
MDFLSSARRKPLPMAQQDFTILNKLGIHARPAAQFVKTANRFQSDIFVEKDGEEVDGKSIMGLMMLAAALAALGDLITRKFEEE